LMNLQRRSREDLTNLETESIKETFQLYKDLTKSET